MEERGPRAWRTPEELVEIGFARSRVVMMNEAHDAWRRCVRTREVGRRVLPVAHGAGVRHLAMEALGPEDAEEANRTGRLPPRDLGYLSQPDMRALVQEALDLGCTLIRYEIDVDQLPGDWPLGGDRAVNWREEYQARNLAAALDALPEGAPLLVWCGWGHLYREASRRWTPMAVWFERLTGTAPFSIDQTVTVKRVRAAKRPWMRPFEPVLRSMGGTAGFLREEAPRSRWLTAADAFLLSLQNDLE